MTSVLLEAGFLTTNLKDVLSKGNKEGASSTAKGATSKASKDDTNATSTKRPANFNWNKELERRLNDNKKLEAESRKQDSVIEREFWTDFYMWLVKDEVIVKKLLLITQLQKDIKILGFSKKTNPLLSFFSLAYVKNNLLAPNPSLIDTGSYKVIHNIVAEQYVSNEELTKANNYNIIYCRDWYRKDIKTMEEYIKLQKEILPPGYTNYSKARLERNIKIFLQQGSKSMTSANAKLTDLKTIKKLVKSSSKTEAEEDEDKQNTTDNTEVSAELKEKNTIAIKSLKTKAQKLAALQYISILTNNKNAKKALSSMHVEGSAKDIAVATAEVQAILNQLRITGKAANQVDAFVDYLVKSLKE